MPRSGVLSSYKPKPPIDKQQLLLAWDRGRGLDWSSRGMPPWKGIFTCSFSINKVFILNSQSTLGKYQFSSWSSCHQRFSAFSSQREISSSKLAFINSLSAWPWPSHSTSWSIYFPALLQKIIKSASDLTLEINKWEYNNKILTTTMHWVITMHQTPC